MGQGAETTLSDVVAAVHGLKPILESIREETKATRIDVTALQAEAAERKAVAAYKAQLIAQGWVDPDHAPPLTDSGVITWRQLWMAGGAIGVVLTGIATAVAKGLGL